MIQHKIMQYTIIFNGKETKRIFGDRRILAEILNESEYEKIIAGEILPFTKSGGLMSLDSILEDGQIIILKTSSKEDLKIFTL